MKNLLIILSLFISQSLFSQNTSDLLKYKIPFFEIDSVVEAKLILGAEVYSPESKAAPLSAIDLSRFPSPQISVRSYSGKMWASWIRGRRGLCRISIPEFRIIMRGTSASQSQIYRINKYWTGKIGRYCE